MEYGIVTWLICFLILAVYVLGPIAVIVIEKRRWNGGYCRVCGSKLEKEETSDPYCSTWVCPEDGTRIDLYWKFIEKSTKKKKEKLLC